MMAFDIARVKSLFLAASDIPDLAERAAYLDCNCMGDVDLRSRVEALLQVNDASPLRSESAPSKDEATLQAETQDHHEIRAEAGSHIAGKYKLLQQIGEGGMGTVWMADQIEPVKRRVALKLIRTDRGQSKTILSRFEAERQAIALMDHENIAKLLDAGTTEAGLPFFVMELVKGVSITEYCDTYKLSIQDRLNLFVKICSAVQHAHQKGIIHRDLKPSNILVESHDGLPVPKVIDFGLAKATSGLQLTENTLFTGFGSVMGTPLYMAPEQANFNAIDVDTRVDVYALGVILFELLTGTTPLTRDTIKKAAMDEMLRLVRELEAPTPSSRLSSSEAKPTIAANRQMEPTKLGSFVKGELDWIVMKALSKERERRYETANGFGKDVERFLAHEPVLAGPPSARYRLRKFVQRNRPKVIAAAVVLLTLVVGVIGTSLALYEAERQRKIAITEVQRKEQARKKARDALDTLTSDALSEWFTREQELSEPQTDVLQRLLGHYAEFAEDGGNSIDDMRGQVNALIRVGRIQRALGDISSAKSSLKRAAEMVGTTEAPITDDQEGLALVSLANQELGTLYREDRSLRLAENCLREVLAAEIRLAGQTNPQKLAARIKLVNARGNLAGNLLEQLRFAEAETEQRQYMLELEQLASEHPEESFVRELLAVHLNHLSVAFENQGKTDQALAHANRSLDLGRELIAVDPESLKLQVLVIRTLERQSFCLFQLDRLRDAIEARREAIRLGFRLCEKFPAVLKYRCELMSNLGMLANHLLSSGKIGDAAAETSKAIAFGRQIVADFPNNKVSRMTLMKAFQQQSEMARRQLDLRLAETSAREMLVECEKLAAMGCDLNTLRSDRANALYCLGFAKQGQGRHNESLADYKESLIELDRLGETASANALHLEMRCNAYLGMSRSYTHNQDPNAAVEALQSTLKIIDKLDISQQGARRANVSLELARALGLANRWRESEEQANEAVRGFDSIKKTDSESEQLSEFLAQSYWQRAVARDKLARHSDAAMDWVSSANLAVAAMDRAFYRAHSGHSWSKSGDLEKAASDLEAAMVAAKAALNASNLHGQAYYDAAVVFALAASALSDSDAAELHAKEAVRLLSQAAAVGFLSDPAQVVALRADEVFLQLQERDDFQELLRGLKRNSPSH